MKCEVCMKIRKSPSEPADRAGDGKSRSYINKSRLQPGKPENG